MKNNRTRDSIILNPETKLEIKYLYSRMSMAYLKARLIENSIGGLIKPNNYNDSLYTDYIVDTVTCLKEKASITEVRNISDAYLKKDPKITAQIFYDMVVILSRDKESFYAYCAKKCGYDCNNEMDLDDFYNYVKLVSAIEKMNEETSKLSDDDLLFNIEVANNVKEMVNENVHKKKYTYHDGHHNK